MFVEAVEAQWKHETPAALIAGMAQCLKSFQKPASSAQSNFK